MKQGMLSLSSYYHYDHDHREPCSGRHDHHDHRDHRDHHDDGESTWPDKIAMPGRILPISMLATLLHSSLKVSKHSTV